MVSRRLLLAATVCSLLLGLLGVWLYARQRASLCGYVPLLAPDLLPSAGLVAPQGGLPAGWVGSTAAISLTDFAVFPGGHSIQLLGIASALQTPVVRSVRPGASYCFAGQALTDSPKGSMARVQVSFQWLDASDALLAEQRSLWQPVTLWRPDAPPAGWSPLSAAFVAPPRAAALRVVLRPASDDRIYVDQMHVRSGGVAAELPDPPSPDLVRALPWPNGRRAALSFSFDWETAMGGLVHTRSVGDPNADQDHLLRGLRMRQGVTTTLELFRPYGIRATYYATGYNFLFGNTEQRTFMNNPTFAWANTEHRWVSNRWANTPWFADDPYAALPQQPAWYFGDLVPLLQRAGQDIQSHTFSHLYGGLASQGEWQADFAAWDEVASAAGVPSARSLAFPWSGSDGLSDDDWNLLEQQGIRSVTRLNDRPPFALVRADDPHCRPVPGHERILACPDFYLTPGSAQQAMALIDSTLAQSGTLDVWAHTEEVVSAAQIGAWRQVVSYAAGKPDLWIAPLAEIAAWQAALAEVQIAHVALNTAAGEPPLTFTVTNGSDMELKDVALALPFVASRYRVNGTALAAASATISLTLAPGESVEVAVWPR